MVGWQYGSSDRRHVAFAYDGRCHVQDDAQQPVEATTLLLADDDATVRHSTALALRCMGYRVLEVQDGQEAIELVGSRHKEIDGLLLDIDMPRQNGFQAWSAIQGINSSLPVLFLSAWSEQDVHACSILQPGVNFLQKPFELKILLDTIQRLVACRVPDP